MSNLPVKHSFSVSPAKLRAARRKQPRTFNAWSRSPSLWYSAGNDGLSETASVASGTIRGYRAVVDRCLAEKKVCFRPVIARCRDTGTHHPLGCSVRWKGLHHTAFKNRYVVSGMLKSAAGDLTELSTTQKDALLSEFTRRWELLSA
jgi:hypothetical protein